MEETFQKQRSLDCLWSDIQDDAETSLTDGFQSRLAEDVKFSASREATHAIICIYVLYELFNFVC